MATVQIISVDFQNVTSGTQFRGQFEEKMKELLKEATDAKRKVILFFDELHRVIGAGMVPIALQLLLNHFLFPGCERV
jgi:ATP-dependent Clp protease ATP-binding subunit ClpA